MLPVVCAVLVIGLGASVALAFLRHASAHWRWRREMQLFVLTAPLVSLILSLPSVGTPHGCVSRLATWMPGSCLSATTGVFTWMVLFDSLLALGMALLALGALARGIVRHLLLVRVMEQTTLLAPPDLQVRADRLAARLGITHPHLRLRLRVSDQPMALTYGLQRPTLVLSTWMVERFDRRELEAVLAHELAHVARRDYLVLWLATMCRDAFCYLPSSWIALKQLQREKEVACDDLAIGIMHSPLGLASALAKVWQQAILAPSLGLAQSLVGARAEVRTEPGSMIEGRITRLLETSPATNTPCSTSTPASARSHTIQVGAIVGLLFLGLLLTVAMLTLMGCAAV